MLILTEAELQSFPQYLIDSLKIYYQAKQLPLRDAMLTYGNYKAELYNSIKYAMKTSLIEKEVANKLFTEVMGLQRYE